MHEVRAGRISGQMRDPLAAHQPIGVQVRETHPTANARSQSIEISRTKQNHERMPRKISVQLQQTQGTRFSDEASYADHRLLTGAVWIAASAGTATRDAPLNCAGSRYSPGFTCLKAVV